MRRLILPVLLAIAPGAASAQMADHGGRTAWMVMADRAEMQVRDGEDSFAWEGSAWWGGDFNKLWLESEGETGLSGGGTEEASVSAAYSRAVSAYFDVQAGLRHDFEPDGRSAAMIGVHGLAPYWFEVGAQTWLDEEGDVFAAFEAEYDLLLTQRLILQPRAELEIAMQDAAALEVGAGVTEISLGARLRYEFRREFAPYVGLEWARSVGETAQIARAAGEDPGGLAAIAGVRIWF